MRQRADRDAQGERGAEPVLVKVQRVQRGDSKEEEQFKSEYWKDFHPKNLLIALRYASCILTLISRQTTAELCTFPQSGSVAVIMYDIAAVKTWLGRQLCCTRM